MFPDISRYPTYQVFLAMVLALVLAIVLFPAWIRLLKFRNIGQQVRADGPQGHLVKQGTPTMGGVLILLVVSVVYLALGEVGRSGMIALVALMGCGLLGFIDDYAKVVKERSLGLTARMKIVGQAVVASTIGILAVNWAHISPEVIVPFVGTLDLGIWQSTLTLGDFVLTMPWLYLGLVFFMVLSFSNTVNLTDGLDGLAAGTVMIVMLAFSAISFAQDNLELALLSASVAGACLGFLWYNSYPADIFMGDTGSLGLGAVIATMAVVTKTELLAPLLGGIYVAEGLSVILQVASFKLTGKRIFRMAPLHHHFEMKGWSETKVMVRFWIVTGALAGAGFALWFVARARF
ncbi:MAG: phospho-N-acetylmuramoyl-pentapeptide-transferase [Coriobacteriia bacterium]